MPTSLTITDGSAAQALASGTPRAIVFALLRRPSSLKTLQQELGFSLSLLHYHVTKLRRLGLVKVNRFEPRAGRSIAIYETTAESFVVPSHLHVRSASSELRSELAEALERELARRSPRAVVYDLGEDRSPRMRRVGSERVSSVGGEWWSRLRLNQKQAAELVVGMQELAARYASSTGAHGRSYLLHFALAKSSNE